MLSVIRAGKQMLDLVASWVVAVVAYEYALWNWAIGIFVSLPVHEYEFTLAPRCVLRHSPLAAIAMSRFCRA